MIKLTEELKSAIAQNKAVVALESTIIAHGMPFPQNLEMAQEVEQIIRDNGAIPATIAVINGELRAGLSKPELENFASTGLSITKVSTRDLPFIATHNNNGATTVAATMHIAAMAGIHTFATGGIGGAHRGAEKNFDISADLFEFSQSNVAVVTAGAKAILDLALTLETLETFGVPVVGYGTDEFPAFYSRSSGHKVPMRCDTPSEIAAMMKAKWAMGLRGGIVVANPIPQEAEIASAEIAPTIESAIAEAKAQNIIGKNVTPFLLKRLAEITQGRSLTANIALVKNNAKLAAEIAVAYTREHEK
jgi:pseudouridylate synthase